MTDADIAARLSQLGPLDVGKEARALVRPDLERLFAINQSATPAAVFDDLLLLACSEWVNERSRIVSMIAGILVTFRSPVTKHVPVLAGLLGGLWDLWRNRTSADSWPDPTGLLSLPPRAVRFVLRLLLEVINNVIQDQEKRPGGGPPIFVPELVVAAIGAWQGISVPKRYTLVSGWEPRATPVAPGTRATARTPEAMARQTLTLIVHPGDRQRFTTPARNVSATMIPPPAVPEQDETERIGSLLIGWDGGLQADEEIGAGLIARFELDGRGFHQVRWGGSRKLVIDARGGASFRATILRPTVVALIPGADIRVTPAVSLAIGVKSGQAEGSYKPALTFRIALNDQEDRITFLPDDELLVQLLPTEGIAVPVDGAFEWTLEHGWRFAGFGEVASGVLIDPAAPLHTPRDPNADFDVPPDPKLLPATEVVTPLNTRLGPHPRLAASLGGRVHIGPGIDYLERAFDASKYGEISASPYLDIAFPSVHDPSMAPAGRHVMSVHMQYAPFKRRSGSWAGQERALSDAMLAALERHAPGISGLVEHLQVITPLILEQEFGLTGGHIHHGELALDQLFTMRPTLGWADYRTPISGLYLCGSGTHPGNALTGASGQNAAREVLKSTSQQRRGVK